MLGQCLFDEAMFSGGDDENDDEERIVQFRERGGEEEIETDDDDPLSLLLKLQAKHIISYSHGATLQYFIIIYKN